MATLELQNSVYQFQKASAEEAGQCPHRDCAVHQRCRQIQKAVQRSRMTLLGPGLCGREGSLKKAALAG